MIEFAWYLLKVTVCSAVLFGYYRFFLRNKVFHTYNRFYLLFAVILSVCLPLITIEFQAPVAANQTTFIKLLDVVTADDDFVADNIKPAAASSTFADTQLIRLGYLLVSCILLFTLIAGCYRIIRMLRKYPVTKSRNIYLVSTRNEAGTPFSFFNYIFWNDDIDLQGEGERILLHEKAHITERHSFDKVFINLVLVVAWCNPIYWLIRRELNIIHEFIADEKAVASGDTAGFAAMLLRVAYPNRQFTLTNHFFRSPIKRRLMMISKNGKRRFSYISRLLILPVAIVLFSAFMLKPKNIERTVKAIPEIFSTNSTSVLSGSAVEEQKPLQQIRNKSSLSVQTNHSITVVLDAGHGGTDAGARNHSGLNYQEKDLTLQLVKRTAAMNGNKNIKIILLREDDVYQSPAEKVKMATAYHPDLFISVHLDGTPGPDWQKSSGLSVFVNNGDHKDVSDRKLGSAIVASFQNNYGIPVKSQLQARRITPMILKSNACPSVIIEAGFITNNKDSKFLASDEGQRSFATNLLAAINIYADANLMPLNRAADRSDTITGQFSIVSDSITVRADTIIVHTPVKPTLDPADDPELYLGSITRARASVDELRKQTALKLSGNFDLESVTAYSRIEVSASIDLPTFDE